MNEQANLPKLRFPGFDTPWTPTTLNQLISESKARNVDLKFTKNEVLSVSGEFGIVNQIQLLGRSFAGESVRNYHIVKHGDIVYTKSPLKANPFGIIKVNKGEPGIVSTLYAVYKVDSRRLSGEFLDYYFSLDDNLNSYLRPLVRKGAKNDMKVNNAHVISAQIYTPTLPEQQKIASFLSKVDEKLSQLKKKKELLEQYKKGMMQKIFSQEVRFKDDNGEEFPEWEEKKFGDVYKFISTNSLSREYLNYEDGTIRNIHYGDIHTKFSILFDIKKEIVPFINVGIDLKKITLEQYCRLGDLVIADASEDYSDIGKAIEIVNTGSEKILAGLHTIHARLKDNGCAIGFGGYMLKCERVRAQIMKIAQGAKVLGISATRLADIEIPIPCKEEQTKIANFLSAIDRKIDHTQTQIDKTEQWKKGLLQQMFV